MKAIERAQLRKEIYLIEKNLVIFDQIEQLKASNYYLAKEDANKQASQMLKRLEDERNNSQKEEDVVRRKSFLPFSKTRIFNKLSMKQLLEKQMKRMIDQRCEETLHRRKLRHSIMSTELDLSDLKAMAHTITTPYEGIQNFSDDSLSSGSEKDKQLRADLENLQQEYTTKAVPEWHPLADPGR